MYYSAIDSNYFSNNIYDKNHETANLIYYTLQAAEHRTNQNDPRNQISGAKINMEEHVLVSGSSHQQNQRFGNPVLESDDVSFAENSKSGSLSTPSSIYHYYEAKVASLIRKNGMLEGQLAAALASREAAEKSREAAFKSRQEIEKRLSDTLKETELLRERLASVELAQEEANSLSNIVHSDNVRLEHDVAFLKAVLDDTQKVYVTHYLMEVLVYKFLFAEFFCL